MVLLVEAEDSSELMVVMDEYVEDDFTGGGGGGALGLPAFSSSADTASAILRLKPVQAAFSARAQRIFQAGEFLWRGQEAFFW